MTAPQSFRDWLRQVETEESPAGHVARLAMDIRWPQGPGSLEEYAFHLLETGSDADYDALGEAWEQYQVIPPPGNQTAYTDGSPFCA